MATRNMLVRYCLFMSHSYKRYPSDTAARVAAGVRAANQDGTVAPYDELRVYGDEGDNHSIATLSSISSAATTVPDLDDRLKQWGPKFNKLSNIYNQGD